jgi:hypothetical protein
MEGPRRIGSEPPPPPATVRTKVVTHMRPGYLRKNGVPYSANTVLTEYWSLYRERNGDQWLVVTTMIEDPQNLTQPFVTAFNFGSRRMPLLLESRQFR